MAMNEILALIGAAAAGAVLGAIFFGGLWLTVKRGLQSKFVALWFFVSWLLRAGITVSGFYWIGGSHWQRLAACLAGFLLARQALTKWVRPTSPANPLHPQEPGHAP